MAVDTAELAYPANVTVMAPEHYGRFWAIPVLGIGVKSVMLIPHVIALYVVGIWISIVQLIAWAPVLFSGTYPDFAFKAVTGYIRWQTRLSAWFVGLVDKYPPFGFGGDYAVDATFEPVVSPGRFWAIPVLGIGVKYVMLIPHLIILSILGNVAALVLVILWIPVLFTGKYPNWGRQLMGGTLAWSARVTAYTFGLTDKYPPFSMDFNG